MPVIHYPTVDELGQGENPLLELGRVSKLLAVYTRIILKAPLKVQAGFDEIPGIVISIHSSVP